MSKNKNASKHHGSVGGSLSTTGTFERCHVKHPTLKLGKGEIVGASCGSPRPGFDVYIGFDYNMQFHIVYPWMEGKFKKLVEFQFKITDGSAPSDVENFKKMVTWVASQLNAGKKVHVGCIGGHGRTGMFLAALVAEMTGEKDAITWVRANHCKEAVETKTQVQFLASHYGVTPQLSSYENGTKGAKKWGTTGSTSGGFYGGSGLNYKPSKPTSDDDIEDMFEAASSFNSKPTQSSSPSSYGTYPRPKAGDTAECMKSHLSVWDEA